MNYTLSVNANNTMAANLSNSTDMDPDIDSSQRKMMAISVVPGSIVFIVCIFILVVLFRRGRMKEVGNIFIANAAFGDAINVTVVVMSEYVFTVLHDGKYINGICKSYNYFFYFQYAYSGWAAALISIERYDLIANCLRRRITVKRACQLVLFVTALSLVFPTLFVIGWDEVKPIKITPRIYMCAVYNPAKETLHALFLPLFYFFNYLIPLIIIVVSFSRVIAIVARHVRAKRRREAIAQNESGNSSPMDVIQTRAFAVIVALIATNVILATPGVVFALALKFDIERFNFRIGSAPAVAVFIFLDLSFKACKRRTPLHPDNRTPKT